MKRIALAFCTYVLLAGVAAAHTITFTWTWPTARVDGSALALSAIGSVTIYDASLPVPGAPGTVVTCNAGTFPPTATTGTCTTGTETAGNHSFIAVVNDNTSPPNVGVATMALPVTVPLSGPAAPTNFAATIN